MQSALQSVHVKVAFQGKTYMLNKFPTTYLDLLDQVVEKLKLPSPNELSFAFIDSEDDQIVLSDDSDVLKMSEIVQSEGKKYAKLIVDNGQTDKKQVQQQPKQNGDPANTCVAECPNNNFDAGKYYDYLKKHLPKSNHHFVRAVANGSPCIECQGYGKDSKSHKCENCYGQGFRPVSGQWAMITKLIDHKIQTLIMDPLEAFLGKETEDPLLNVSEEVSIIEEPKKEKSELSSADHFRNRPVNISARPGAHKREQETMPNSRQTNPIRKMSSRGEYNENLKANLEDKYALVLTSVPLGVNMVQTREINGFSRKT